MSFLTLDHITHYYFSPTGYTKALEEVSFTVDEGEFISIIGPSGCGKSTVLSIIGRLLKQTEGEITLKGQPLMDVPLNIGYMLQQDYLFPWKTILDNVLMGPKISRTLSAEMNARARELLDEVDLRHTESNYPSELSGGMRQRISLVRTLINDPEILLLDEPFSALDYVTKLKLENVVAKMMKTYNKTAILVTHDIGEAISMSDRIVLMEGASPGKVAQIFEIPNELRETPPFYVRRHPKYQPIFDEIWQKINEGDSSQDGKGVTHDERDD